MKFSIGQPMQRDEDLHLITGRGRYTDDVILPRMTHAFVLRSPVAHAHIKRIDTAAARRMPGVLFVATGEDVRVDGLGDVPCMVPLVNRDGTPRRDTPRPVLALGKVRHVGQPVALVVAETLLAARDAAEAIEVEYDPLPAVPRLRMRSALVHRNFSTTSPATSSSTGTMTWAMPRRPTPHSRGPARCPARTRQ